MSTLATQPFIDMSTAYLPADERAALWGPMQTVRTIPHEYGAMVHVPIDDTDETAAQVATDGLPVLAGLLIKAAAAGAWWINFDRDGDVSHPLPTFD